MKALIMYLVSSFLCVFSSRRTKNHMMRIKDIIHDNIVPNFFSKYISNLVSNPVLKRMVYTLFSTYISDIMILIQCVFSSCFLTYNDFKEIFLIMSIVQFMRMICSISTVLPPLKSYNEKIRLFGINGNGTEYIFSGHASYSSIFTMYLYSKNIINPYILLIYNLISQSQISITRNHYTVDVILAWIIVPLLYSNLQLSKMNISFFPNLKYLLDI